MPLRLLPLPAALVVLLCAAGCPSVDEQGSGPAAAELAALPADAAADAINAIDDEVAQLAMVEILFLEHGQALGGADLCAGLDRERVARRCSSLKERPHLLVDAGGACDDTCLRRDTPLACAREAAAAAVEADAPRPEDACGCVDAGRARDECRFEVAELLIEHQGIDGFERAHALCLDAGDYAGSCAEHLLLRLAADPPPLTTDGAAAWSERANHALRIRAVVATAGRRLLPDATDTYWSLSFREAMRGATGVAPEIVAALPVGAPRHLRAAAAWQLEQLDPDPDAGLDERVERLSSLLAGEATLPPGEAGDADYGALNAAPPPRREDRSPGAARVRTTAYLGRDRRPYSIDERADLAICVVEAHLRQHGDRAGLLAEALAADDPALRQSAQAHAARK